MIAYIDAHRVEYGVESICGASQFAPRTYYASKARPVSNREVRDKVECPLILVPGSFGVFTASQGQGHDYDETREALS